MSIERAAEVIESLMLEYGFGPDGGAAAKIANALSDAGLLAGGWKDIKDAPERQDVLVLMTHSLGDGEWETIQWVDFLLPDVGWVHYRGRVDIPFPPTAWQPLPLPPAEG